jgi:N-acylglucosamine 2-epimerase
MLSAERLASLAAVYRDGLHDTLRFWIEHAVDVEHGGFFTCLDRDGTVIDTDKAIWPQARFTWLLATLHETPGVTCPAGQSASLLELARNGVSFIERHAFADDGGMLFLVTRDGRPLRRRRYVFSEAFTSMAFAAYARVADSPGHGTRALELFDRFTRVALTPGHIAPKYEPATRPMKSIGPIMIAINVAQVLRETIGFADADTWIDRCIDEIRRDFVKPERRAVMEVVGEDGAIIDHFDGRTLNPGHAIEAAWFILHEARCRGGDAELIRLGTRMLDWMWTRGWDETCGGLRYFCDIDDKPVQEYWHDMKFWWPHNEAIIATLLAARLTGEERYLDWHGTVHGWAHEHFADREHGEWFGYLHRDGRLSVSSKGNHWKGPFHLPRMQWYCWRLLEDWGPDVR